jgi:hypothetical protein
MSPDPIDVLCYLFASCNFILHEVMGVQRRTSLIEAQRTVVGSWGELGGWNGSFASAG